MLFHPLIVDLNGVHFRGTACAFDSLEAALSALEAQAIRLAMLQCCVAWVNAVEAIPREDVPREYAELDSEAATKYALTPDGYVAA
jgi:hypothetical protein